MRGAIADLGIGLRRAVAIEQLESGPWTEPQALVPPMDDPELTFCDDAKLHMIDPSIVEARCRGSADQIGEGDAVIAGTGQGRGAIAVLACGAPHVDVREQRRSEEHTSELQSLMRISYAVCCLKKTKNKKTT